MAVSIVPNSASCRVTQRPTVGAPVFANPDVSFPNGKQILATGSVKFNIDPGDSTGGWFLGWLQAQWIETNWGAYLGAANSDGSCFFQRARPPARPAQGCRDTFGPVTQIFYGIEPQRRASIPAGPFQPGHPVLISTHFNDGPADNYPMRVTNSATHKDNLLSEVQLEFHFCTVLVVRDPAGVFTQLKHFYWNVHWQYRFHPGGFPMTTANTRVIPVANGVSANVSPVYDGRVTDKRFVTLLTSTHETKSCNDMAGDETNSPNIRVSSKWSEFDVRR